ncbi:ribose-phosphate pyrophosphokinase-like domain-containing protein [Streptomyces gibsoniae]|uniref:ribose-phosphate pyrophosphokinase-like domain-containing protein n=1 Tax=Streptomyces gibsoniae TaxID=3075529 RepID=UPI00374E1E0A
MGPVVTLRCGASRRASRVCELRPAVGQVRGADVYVIQPMEPKIDEHLVQLLLLLGACRRGGAHRLCRAGRAAARPQGHRRKPHGARRTAAAGRRGRTGASSSPPHPSASVAASGSRAGGHRRPWRSAARPPGAPPDRHPHRSTPVRDRGRCHDLTHHLGAEPDARTGARPR